ncbi:MAG: MFS transporter [Fusobacteriaceae bacterium]|jgi:MFS family permease|nr:MFS transporter [Fusobacteriaceae bacterium]
MKKKYIIEVVLFCSYALFAMSWKAGDFFIAKLGITATQTAIMTNAINIAKVIGCLAAAVVISKLGMRNTYTYSTILVIFGVLLPLTNLFPAIFLIRFILGLGGAFIVVAMNPIASRIFEPGELAIVNGLNAVAFNTGLAVALTLAGRIIADPKTAIITVSLILTGALVLWLILSGDLKVAKGPTQAAQPAEKYGLGDGVKDPFNILMALGNIGLLSFYLVAMTFMDPAYVKYVIYAGIAGALAGSFGSKGVKNKMLFVRITALMQLLSACGFILCYVSGSTLINVLGLILGFFIFFPLSAYITLGFIREGATPQKISVTFSLFWSLGYLGTVVIMQIFGFLKDKTGGMTTPLIFILCCEALFFLATLFIRITKSK